MLIGRENEMQDLSALYEAKGFQFAAVYGRRRVGKTRLISEFIVGKQAVYFTATQNEHEVLLRDFTKAVSEAFPDNALLHNMESFTSFDAAFSFIADEAKDKKLILVIDEYPYLAKSYPAISSILQRIIDRNFKKTNLFLILSGSSMSFMEKQILGYESPLYGRRTGQIKLSPLPYYESIKFFPDWSDEEKLYAYGVCGGIPQYLEIAARWGSLKDAVTHELLSSSGGLYSEPEFLIREELREPAIYNSIIDAIVGGKNKVNEIASAINKSGNSISSYLKNLQSLEIIEKKIPVEETSSKKTIYYLADPLFHFWYRFIPDCRFYILMRKGSEAFDNRIAPYLSEYFGHIFEKVCLQFILKKTEIGEIKEIYSEYGAWWGTNPHTKQQEDIDILCTDKENILAGECKWKNDKVDFAIYNTLAGRTEIVKKGRKAEYILFSKSGFEEKLTSSDLKDLHLHLISMNDIINVE